MKYLKIGLIAFCVLVLAVSGIAYVIYSNANTELKALDESARRNVSGSFVRLSGGITHYELSGPDTGRVVLLVHGFSVPYYIWDSTQAGLAAAGFRVLRFDMFGRGYSDRPDKVYDAALYRSQISELLDSLGIKSLYALAGVSFGSAVATDFVVTHPELAKKIILVDPIFPGFDPTGYPEFMIRFQMAIAPENLVAGQLTDLKYPARFPRWADQYRVQMQYTGFRRALVSTMTHYGPRDIATANYKRLNQLNKPVLLIWGKEDNTVPFKRSDSLRSVLKTTFVPVEDAAHLPQMEKASFVNEKIISFLNSGQ